ncbi:hypothetical protein SDC9_167380 [bioreactor metagenome]|uniref:Uncharacterized protein n=1 Tax=bioreactor metagenome TaxID=1076179 RepID=A0A645G7B7_9ZZZZ
MRGRLRLMQAAGKEGVGNTTTGKGGLMSEGIDAEGETRGNNAALAHQIRYRGLGHQTSVRGTGP